MGSHQKTPIIAGEWDLKSYNSKGILLGKSAVITIVQDQGQLVSLLEGTRTYEGYLQQNTLNLSGPCPKNQGCDSTEIKGVVSAEALSGTWKDIKNEEVVNMGRWIAERKRGEAKGPAVPDVNGNWAFKIFTKEGLAEERTITIFQEGQRITIREQEEEEYKGFISDSDIYAYAILPDKNEIVEIEGAISGKTMSGDWKVQDGRSLEEEGTWEAQKK